MTFPLIFLSKNCQKFILLRNFCQRQLWNFLQERKKQSTHGFRKMLKILANFYVFFGEKFIIPVHPSR